MDVLPANFAGRGCGAKGFSTFLLCWQHDARNPLCSTTRCLRMQFTSLIQRLLQPVGSRAHAGPAAFQLRESRSKRRESTMYLEQTSCTKWTRQVQSGPAR
jgi:hypothetical protein